MRGIILLVEAHKRKQTLQVAGFAGPMWLMVSKSDEIRSLTVCFSCSVNIKMLLLIH